MAQRVLHHHIAHGHDELVVRSVESSSRIRNAILEQQGNAQVPRRSRVFGRELQRAPRSRLGESELSVPR